MATPCEATAEECAAWRRFRTQHPFRYQTIAVDSHAESGSITVILSEVPSIGSKSTYVELLTNTYLSSQLQDSEFGTLLNIADQELKSWSECSRVRNA